MKWWLRWCVCVMGLPLLAARCEGPPTTASVQVTADDVDPAPPVVPGAFDEHPDSVGDGCDGYVERDLSWLREICDSAQDAVHAVEVDHSEADILVALTLNGPRADPDSSAWPAVGLGAQSITSMAIELSANEPLALVHVPEALVPNGPRQPELAYTLEQARSAPVGTALASGATVLGRWPDVDVVRVDALQMALEPGFFHLIRLRQDRRAAPLSLSASWSIAFSDDTHHCRYNTTPPPSVSLVARGPLCGDGLLEEGEACDDGNVQGGDGCHQCAVEPLLCGEPAEARPWQAWSCQAEGQACVALSCGGQGDGGVCGQPPTQRLRLKHAGRATAQAFDGFWLQEPELGFECRCVPGVRGGCEDACDWQPESCATMTAQLRSPGPEGHPVRWPLTDGCQAERCQVAVNQPRLIEAEVELDAGAHFEPPEDTCFEHMLAPNGDTLVHCARHLDGQARYALARRSWDGAVRWEVPMWRWGEARLRAWGPSADLGAWAIIEAVDPMIIGCTEVPQGQSVLVKFDAGGMWSAAHVFEPYAYPSHILVRPDQSLVVASPGPQPEHLWGLSMMLFDAQGRLQGSEPIASDAQAIEVRLAEDGRQVVLLTTGGVPEQTPLEVARSPLEPPVSGVAGGLYRLDPDAGWGTVWRQQWWRSRDFDWRPSSMDVSAEGHVGLLERFMGDPVADDAWAGQSLERLVVFDARGQVAWHALLEPDEPCRAYDHAIVADEAGAHWFVVGHRECVTGGFDAAALVVDKLTIGGELVWSERVRARRPFDPQTSFWGMSVQHVQASPLDGRLMLTGYGAALWPPEVDGPQRSGHMRVWLDP